MKPGVNTYGSHSGFQCIFQYGVQEGGHALGLLGPVLNPHQTKFSIATLTSVDCCGRNDPTINGIQSVGLQAFWNKQKHLAPPLGLPQL